MRPTSAGRRRALVAVALFTAAIATRAFAQNPQQSGAVAAARDWLVLVDAGDVKGMYDSAGKRFRDGISEEKWAEVAKQGHEYFGGVTQRTLIGAQTAPETPNRPKGEFVTVMFRSDFKKRDVGQEHLTVEHEADGKWRVIGYLMR